MLIAVRRQGRTGHVIEREVGLTVLGKPRVEEPRNVRMIQARKNLALAGEALAHHATLEGRVDELQGHLSGEQAVGALREPYAPHAPVAEERQHAVGAELLADEPGIGLDQRGDVTGHQSARFQKAPFARFLLRGAQCSQQHRRFWISALQRGEPRLALPARHLDRFVEECREA